MHSGSRERRGQPILFLGLLLAGWMLFRVVTWETPWPLASGATSLAQALGTPQVRAPDTTHPRADRGQGEAAAQGSDWPAPMVAAAPERTLLSAPPSARGAAEDQDFASDRRAFGHNLLWIAGMANLPMPRSVASWLDNGPVVAAQVPAHPPRANSRTTPWRIDAWLMLREGASPAPGGGIRPASYGASQAGAVIAYRLAPSSRRDPAAYARAAKALVTDGESEAAFGLRARPLAGLPIVAHAEMRIVRVSGETTLRPAAFLSGGVDDARLPLGLTASGYAQAGYVGGKFATPFADGALRVERELAQFDLAKVSAGAGAWGGAQRDAVRVDVGPTAGVCLIIGDTPARISADYRIRVAGNAAPASGAAITLSTGF
ncbi:hypothetical protein [Qipengyuania zhejiangensis]|uniref:hypothetical protein n=1 Tax=Qipengyuania zhejiangensis TaxID=3077782 RepID=UPI002D795C52|nr:hypothetical protein [Qipengyuania sp. Z2]